MKNINSLFTYVSKQSLQASESLVFSNDLLRVSWCAGYDQILFSHICFSYGFEFNNSMISQYNLGSLSSPKSSKIRY